MHLISPNMSYLEIAPSFFVGSADKFVVFLYLSITVRLSSVKRLMVRYEALLEVEHRLLTLRLHSC